MPCNCRHGTGPHAHVGDASFAQDGAFGVGHLLNGFISASGVQCWNVLQSASDVFRIALAPKPEPNSARAPEDDVGEIPFVSSDADAEILLHIPFEEMLRIRGILVEGTTDNAAPSKLRVFVNRTDVTGFDSVQRLQPVQEIVLAAPLVSETVIYRLNPTLFNTCASITVYITESLAGEDEPTHLTRIEFYGESTRQPVNRPLATNVVYESMANPADHKVLEDGKKASSMIS